MGKKYGMLSFLRPEFENQLLGKIQKLSAIAPLQIDLAQDFRDLETRLKSSTQCYSVLLLDPFREDLEPDTFYTLWKSYQQKYLSHLVLVTRPEGLASFKSPYPYSGHIQSHFTSYQVAFLLNRLVFGDYSERREFPRAAVNVPVEHTQNFETFEPIGEAVSLSSGGMFIRTDEELEKNALIHVRLIIREGKEFIECSGRVVYNRKQVPALEDVFPSGVGVCFRGINEIDRLKIGEYVRTSTLR